MATYAAPIPQIVAHDAKPEPRGWTSWMTTTDHKRIGIMYMVTTFVFFVLGGVEALMIRLQLGAPGKHADLTADLQPAVHDARHHDDLPVRRADDGGARQLLRAADDRRARHGLPAPERALLLAAARRRSRVLRLDLLEPAGSGLDELRAAVGHRPTRPAADRTRGSSWSTSPASPRFSARSTSTRRSPTCARAV